MKNEEWKGEGLYSLAYQHIGKLAYQSRNLSFSSGEGNLH
jgi:hypothetical protein